MIITTNQSAFMRNFTLSICSFCSWFPSHKQRQKGKHGETNELIELIAKYARARTQQTSKCIVSTACSLLHRLD